MGDGLGALRSALPVFLCAVATLWAISQSHQVSSLGGSTDEGQFYSDLAIKQILANPTSLQPSRGARLNSSMCARASYEYKYIDEWLIYHRLLGIQEFYLYDLENNPELHRLLVPWIESGIVYLHTLTYQNESLPKPEFWGEYSQDCLSRYANRSEWLWTHDVDEYVKFDQIYGIDTHPSWDATNLWRHPLHDYLHRPFLRMARCIPLSRNGAVVNVGVLDLPARASVLDSHLWRSARLPYSEAPGKVLLRSSTAGLLAEWQGHTCEPNENQIDRLDIVKPGGWGAIQTSSSGVVDTSDDPLVYEPITIHHYQQRSLEACKETVKHYAWQHNWRAMNGGAAYCAREFVMTPEQASSSLFQQDQFAAEFQTELYGVVVKDSAIRDSWYGQTTVRILKMLQRGQASMPVRDAAGTLAKTIHIRLPNPVDGADR